MEDEEEQHANALGHLRTAIDILSHAQSVLEASGTMSPAEWHSAAESAASQVLALMTGAGLWTPSPPSVRISHGRGSKKNLAKLKRTGENTQTNDSAATGWSMRHTHVFERPCGQQSISTPTSLGSSDADPTDKEVSTPSEPLILESSTSSGRSTAEPSNLQTTRIPKLTELSVVDHGSRRPLRRAFSELQVDVHDIVCKPSEPTASCLLREVKALLIDLDGTMYTPTGLIPGADAFYAYLLHNQIPFVFLSNTGSKGPEGVQTKLEARGLMQGTGRVPLSNIYTAAQAQCAYLLDHIPPSGRVFVLAGAAEPRANSIALQQVWWMELLFACAAEGGTGAAQDRMRLIDSWQIRTALTGEETAEWAAVASAHLDRQCVFVVLFTDGQICSTLDPTIGKNGHDDWSFETIKHMSYLLSHGAEFVCTAEDSFNPTREGFPLPGPGMFSAMFRKLMYPLGRSRLHICGKGGGVEEGGKYMVGRAVEMLREQGFDGELRDILIVGDRFDTDIRAGVRAGLTTCLVESGCHSFDLQNFYPADSAHFVAASVAHLLPLSSPLRYTLDCAALPKPASRRSSPHNSMDELPHHDALAKSPPIRGAAATPGSLRSWILARGNLIHASSIRSAPVPLIRRLREYFEVKDPCDTGYITIFDVFQALEELGIAPSSKGIGCSQRPSPRAVPCTPRGTAAAQANTAQSIALGCNIYRLQTFMTEYDSGSATINVSCFSRVTFRELCREVQYCINKSAGDNMCTASDLELSSRSLRAATAPALCKLRSATAKAKAVSAFSRLPSPSHFYTPGLGPGPPKKWKKHVQSLPELRLAALPGIEAEEESSLFGSQMTPLPPSSPRWVCEGGLTSPGRSSCGCSNNKPSPLAAALRL